MAFVNGERSFDLVMPRYNESNWAGTLTIGIIVTSKVLSPSNIGPIPSGMSGVKEVYYFAG